MAFVSSAGQTPACRERNARSRPCETGEVFLLLRVVAEHLSGWEGESTWCETAAPSATVHDDRVDRLHVGQLRQNRARRIRADLDANAPSRRRPSITVSGISPSDRCDRNPRPRQERRACRGTFAAGTSSDPVGVGRIRSIRSLPRKRCAETRRRPFCCVLPRHFTRLVGR